MNADGSGQRRLARHATTSFSAPTWSPDGRKLAFVSDRDGFVSVYTPEIHVVNVDGSGQRNLTRNPASDSDPVWSPDGRKITFVRNFEIYVMNADGTGQTNLTRNPAHDFAPAWSPDGTADRLRTPARTTTVRRLPRLRWSDDLRGARHERRRQRAATADAKRRAGPRGRDRRTASLVAGREPDRLRPRARRRRRGLRHERRRQRAAKRVPSSAWARHRVRLVARAEVGASSARPASSSRSSILSFAVASGSSYSMARITPDTSWRLA